MNGKHFVVATLFALVLLTLVFVPISSQLGTYDPWLDVNEDGKIDIKDLATAAKAYGTLGDPTKNVTVTNWPAKRTLNASLADNLLIDSSQAWLFEANVEGYSKVTVVMKGETYMAGLLSVDVRFKIGGVLSPSVYKNYTHPEGYSFLLRNYEVIGPTLWMELLCDGEWRISIGIYATD